MATVDGIANALVLNMKIEFADASRIFHKVPKTITLKVRLGVDGSSVVGTMADTYTFVLSVTTSLSYESASFSSISKWSGSSSSATLEKPNAMF